jgi:hypothetical protein
MQKRSAGYGDGINKVLARILYRDYPDKPETVKCILEKLQTSPAFEVSYESLLFVNNDDVIEKTLRPHIDSVKASK